MKLNSKKFLSEKEIYWEPFYSEYYGNFELVEFSAKYLMNLLDQCIINYRRYLLEKGKLPPDVYFFGVGDDMLEQLKFLDESLLPEGGAVRLAVKR